MLGIAQPLTKSVVAKRQLATAIRLLFSGRDTVSIYSLASNAWEVIDVLCQRAGVNSLSSQTRENVPQGRDLKRHFINSPYRNFFKHAESDPDEVLAPLPNSQTDAVIFLAVEDYLRLNGKSPVEFQVFQLWYIAMNPEKLDPKVAESVLEAADHTFPGIGKLDRRSQLDFGTRLLDEFEQDEELKSDPRTEPAFA